MGAPALSPKLAMVLHADRHADARPAFPEPIPAHDGQPPAGLAPRLEGQGCMHSVRANIAFEHEVLVALYDKMTSKMLDLKDNQHCGCSAEFATSTSTRVAGKCSGMKATPGAEACSHVACSIDRSLETLVLHTT